MKASEIPQASDAEFSDLCRKILSGLGMRKAREFEATGIQHAFHSKLVRESTDKMFRSEETWLCVFGRPSPAMPAMFATAAQEIQRIRDAALAADAGFFLLVAFGHLPSEARAGLDRSLAAQGIRVATLDGVLAQRLAMDYAGLEATAPGADGFSFSRLRDSVKAQVEAAPWRKHFQTASIQPGRVLPLQAEEDASLAESDLVRVLHGGSFLLLGEPGAGKTTSLLDLAQELVDAGPLTPLFLPLGRYQGDLWAVLREALAPGAEAVAKSTAQSLVESGALVLLLDGLNEVQNPELQARLAEELNRLTDPDEPTARGRWIVSGRVHDYEQGHQHLIHLEARRWEIQPFTADLVYQLLADALGKDKGLALYHELGESVRELCSNPLLLNMVLTVYKDQGRAPVGRGALYRRFLDLLLRWGDERQLLARERQELDRLWPHPLTEEVYQGLVRDALTRLAAAVTSTQIPWRQAQGQFTAALSQAHRPEQAAAVLLDDLTRRGMLRRDVANRVSFFHHTIQEYFHALGLRERPVDELIPAGGVGPAQREAVVFLAGLLEDPTPLARRALTVDPVLTFEIVRDAPDAVPGDVTQDLAQTLWSHAWTGGGFTGSQRPWALRFQRLAGLRDQTVETLAADVDRHLSAEQQTERLMGFYAEMGDAQAQERILAKALEGEEVPEPLLFRAALAARSSGDLKRSVALYSRYLEIHPREPAAYHNRAVAYGALGRKGEALADYERAVELDADAVRRTNYAVLLHELDRKDEAREQVGLALKQEPTAAYAHEQLARWLEPEDPEAALPHWEQAVRYVPHDEDLRVYLPRLASLQEKLNHHAGAIRTLRRMIALDPTSSQVKSWKQRIAARRLAVDAEARTRSVRERLQEQGELPLPTLVVEWLKAAGLRVENATSAWVLARGRGHGPGDLPVVLMPEPRVTGARLRSALEAVRRQAWNARQIVVVTNAETLEREAHLQWAALQDEVTLGLINALEVRDALLQTDLECRRLLDRVLGRSGQLDDPFAYKGVVREHTEFFGRGGEINDILARLVRGQQVGLYGIHKIGKSSLMEQLRRNLHISHPEITVLQIELEGHDPGPGSFYLRVLEKLPGVSNLPQPQSLTARDFRRALSDYHGRRARTHPGHRLLLMVDEYAFLLPDSRGEGGLPGFLEVLSLLKTLHQEGWLLLLPCGRSAALNRQAGWKEGENPFIDLLHPRFLGPLSREENDALMTTLGRRAKLTFTPEALAAVFAETAGHPSFSRALGSQIVEGGTDQVTAARVHQAVAELLKSQDQTNVLRAIYEARMDQDEQEIARILASQGPQPRRSLFPAAADTPRRRQIRDALANLLDTTVLVEQPDGRIAHRYGLLRRVIQREAEELGLD